MKKSLSLLLLLIGSVMTNQMQSMQETPDNIERFKEMATQYAQGLPELWNKLSPEERVFIYYMYRASLPGNRILADQNHRDAVKLIELCEFIVEHADELKKCELKFDADALVQDVQTYLVYLWTNHGQYFSWEHANQKRTPERIGLKNINTRKFFSSFN